MSGGGGGGRRLMGAARDFFEEKIYGHPVSAILTSDDSMACVNLSGVSFGLPRATMRVAPGDPDKPAASKAVFYVRFFTKPVAVHVIGCSASQNLEGCSVVQL
ncbi:hypothetical protein [Stutzerimonas stutzeri]|nr:hypothetical protein [Stutzerimonas stutzeri]MCQ4322724.1 hypothetical protein [Stutzerimonas stutzeri]